ncbi:SUMO-conjugating enzyme UBC9 [Coccomyxa sp. Obi]|nr:SUMO-conjugating enzyme UBC9 [Coccomyxa sp. Obi]
MSGVAQERLVQERKAWRQDHPFGFVAKPRSLPDGSVDMLHWDCRILGKTNTAWEGGVYPLELKFSEEYPSRPPVAEFPKGFFHPNVYASGTVSLRILSTVPKMGCATSTWEPSITVKQILMGISDLLYEPNIDSPAQFYGWEVCREDMGKYTRLVKEQARKYSDENYSTI